MPARLLLNLLAQGRFWFAILLLQTATESWCAAGQSRVVGLLPTAAQGALTATGRVPGTNQLRLALSLPLRQAGDLTNFLFSLYNPASPEFHHYLTPQAFTARFGPTPAAYAAVVEFARTNGLTVTAVHSNRLLVDVTGRVADVERALHVRLHTFRHPAEPRIFFAPDRPPTVDDQLPLLQVSGLDDFYRLHPNVWLRPIPTPPGKSPHGGSGLNGLFLGNDLRQAYVPGTALTGAGQSVGLLEFDGFNVADITNYANTLGFTNNPPPVTVVPVDGGITVTGGNVGEVTLDIEMVLAMAPGVSNIYVYEATNSCPWVDILSQMVEDDLAAQLSCSWSGGGPDPASEQVFLQMAAQGQSFFNASGDTGAFTNAIAFPCVSPNITQVGGTSLITDTNGDYLSESAWNQGGGVATGGGIGLSVEIPVWQMGLDLTSAGGSTAWRNVPDVALTADGVYEFVDGQATVAAGTSCAAPLWAGFMALINQQSAQLGQPPVGFLNPAIYTLCRGTNYPALFHDITSGNNTNLCSLTNFSAAPGFDLCTGWGTPAGTNLINALTTPDSLGILPQSVFSTSGQVGGPFPQTNWLITLTNVGAASLDWSLGGAPAWLTISAANGKLAPNGATNLNLQWVNPNGFLAGGYRAALMITNEALSRVQNVLVRIDIGQSLVQNGGFETGDFTGWTLAGDAVTWHQVCNIVATDADFPGVVHSGSYGALLGQSGYAATLSQLVPTIPGQPYLISFWLDNLQASSGQQFNATWNGTNFASLVDPPAFAWSNFQFAATANSTNATLAFAAENDQNYFGFDDVTVTPVPPVAFTDYWVSPNGFQLAWPSAAGLSYLVQCATDLAQSNWLDAGFVVAATNLSTFVDTNPPAGSAQLYYRLLLFP